MDTLSAQDLTLGFGEKIIIEDLDIAIPKGEITVLIGKNGCGKSTLLRSLARLLKPKHGKVYLDHKDITKLKTKDIAKKLSILPQAPQAPEGLTVYELVKQGRHPHRTLLKQWSEEDEAAVQHALSCTNITDLADQPVDSLSGGQRQRAWIALTLAQQTDTILLDEPTTYLDLAHQVDVLDLLFELNETEGRTIVMVLHDLNLASRYADHIIALKDKQIYAQGNPEDIITPELVHTVFDMPCQIACDPIFGTPLCIPFGKGRCIRNQTKAPIEQVLN